MKKALPYVITSAIGLGVTLIIILAKGIYSQTETTAVMQILCDAFFVPGIILAGVGLIVWASNGGAFDMLGYGVRLFFDMFRKDVTKRKYKDFYEYRQAKKQSGRKVGFMLIVGLVFIAISCIFLILYYYV